MPKVLVLKVRGRHPCGISRDQKKTTQTFFCTKFFDTPSGHGCPHRKSWTSAPKSAFSCGHGGGRNFLTPGHPGVRVKNVRGKSGPKSLCLCRFFFPEINSKISFLSVMPFGRPLRVVPSPYELPEILNFHPPGSKILWIARDDECICLLLELTTL